MKNVMPWLRDAGYPSIDSLNAEVIQSSSLDWTNLRFRRLVSGRPTGNYRLGDVDRESSPHLSRADAAGSVLRGLEETKWLHRLPLVSY